MALKKKRFNIDKFFGQCGYNPDIWDGINIQDIQEIDYDTFRADCFLLYRPVGGAVFHFMKCKEVRADEKIGWIKSYRFTDDLSGGFKLFDGSKQTLKPCECCLAEWDNGNGWENYSSADDTTKKTIKDNFNIETFFDHCSEKEPRPAELSELYKLMDDNIVWLGADIDNDYPRNWSDISNMYRAAKRYRCGQCGVDLSEHKDLAVTHHVNGVHSDVSAENIKVLCVWCHSKQPHHEKTVRINRDQYLLLRRLWREQGIRFEDVS